MDLLSYYGWFVLGGLTAVWLVVVAGPIIGRKWQPRLVLVSTGVIVIFAGLLMANDRWGAGAVHRAHCTDLRGRYDRATTLVELERARDRLREKRCRLSADTP